MCTFNNNPETRDTRRIERAHLLDKGDLDTMWRHQGDIAEDESFWGYQSDPNRTWLQRNRAQAIGRARGRDALRGRLVESVPGGELPPFPKQLRPDIVGYPEPSQYDPQMSPPKFERTPTYKPRYGLKNKPPKKQTPPNQRK